MPEEVDKNFYDRADEHIYLSNDQLKTFRFPGKVSASMLYSVARFNAWVSACGFKSGEEMARARQSKIDFFTEQYRLMLEENLDDYITNFSKYMLSE